MDEKWLKDRVKQERLTRIHPDQGCKQESIVVASESRQESQVDIANFLKICLEVCGILFNGCDWKDSILIDREGLLPQEKAHK